MGWKHIRRLAVILLAVGVLSGCGGAALVSSAPVSSPPAPAPTVIRDPTLSVSYCQQLTSGAWVTNDSANSTTPCVPDPAYAVRYERAGEDIAVPRCSTCTLSDWQSADHLAQQQTGQTTTSTSSAPTSAPTPGVAKWSLGVRASFISNCNTYMTGSLCQCLANHLAWQVPADQVPGLSGEDLRVQVAAKECRS